MMGLSSNLISQFVKVTNDKPKYGQEATVYGTTIKYGEKMYVNIDGSDLLTPITTTTELKEGERVTVRIKDHAATVTGNITTPSASTDTTDAILAGLYLVEAKIGDFELVMADKVTTKELDAELARIDLAIIEKAEIEDLIALEAKIANLEVDTLNAKLAEIDKALIDKAEIVDLKAAVADIEILESELINVKTLIGGNLTMENIQSLVLTSSKVTVDNAFIKDAMVDTISANKINTGSINTNNVNITSDDGSMIIDGSLQQFKDDAGNVRIQIGKDSSGDFTFILYGADGTGQLINQNGITSSAISDGLIVDKMVADNAAISGTKLDINSVITEINENETTIRSSKIYFDDEEQTLDVLFNEMNTKIENAGGVDSETIEQIETNATNISIVQGQISSLITNTTITKEDGVVVQLKDLLNTTIDTVSNHAQTISSLTTNYDTLSGDIATVESTLATTQHNLDGFITSVSNSYYNKETTDGLLDSIEERVSSAEQKITADAIINTVTSSSKWTEQYEEIEAANSAITQTANKIGWLVQSGTSSSNMQLTSDALRIISENIDLTGKVTFNSLSNDVMSEIYNTIDDGINSTVIDGANIKTGSITAKQIAANTITSDEIAAGSISVDSLSSNNSNPIIRLFDRCAIDATARNEQGQGDAIRLKWSDYDYILVRQNDIEFYTYGGSTETPLLSFTGTPSQAVITQPSGSELQLNYQDMRYRGYIVLTAENYTSYCARSSHTHSGYAESGHTHDRMSYGSSLIDMWGSYMYIESGTLYTSGYMSHDGSIDPSSSGSYNLGYSGARWNQISAYDIYADYCSGSDIDIKENVRYIQPNDIATFNARSMNNAETILKPNEEHNVDLGITGEDLYNFVKYELKLCEYNYTDEYKSNSPRGSFENRLGFVAQDIKDTKVGTLIVGERDGQLSYSLNNYMSALGGALQYEITNRDAQIDMLMATIELLEERLNKLEK